MSTPVDQLAIAAGTFGVDELLARPDADETLERIELAIGEAGLPATLIALAVLRTRAAAEANT